MTRTQSTCARMANRGEQSWANLFTRWAGAALWLLAVVPASAQSDSTPSASVRVPKHVYVAPCLRETVESMLHRSPTFRAQVETLARTPALGVAIVLHASQLTRPAQATIRHYDSGLMVAQVRLHTISDKEELIAHEIEHVIEQIERVPLDKLARTTTEAWWTGNSFETTRAIRTGRRVASEMRSAESLTQ